MYVAKDNRSISDKVLDTVFNTIRFYLLNALSLIIIIVPWSLLFTDDDCNLGVSFGYMLFFAPLIIAPISTIFCLCINIVYKYILHRETSILIKWWSAVIYGITYFPASLAEDLLRNVLGNEYVKFLMNNVSINLIIINLFGIIIYAVIIELFNFIRRKIKQHKSIAQE